LEFPKSIKARVHCYDDDVTLTRARNPAVKLSLPQDQKKKTEMWKKIKKN